MVEKTNPTLEENVPPEVPKPSKLPKWFIRVFPWILVVMAIVAGSALGGLMWYKAQLTALDASSDQLKPINIVSGSTPRQIGELLEQESVIRSATAFDIYTRLSGVQGALQAGTYRLSPAETIPEITAHLTKGSVDKFNLTFFPGATLDNISNAPENRRSDTRGILERAGYSSQEIDQAFEKQYDHPVFRDKPESADLEGYIYGETYSFSSSATVEDILIRTFDELWAAIEDNNLINEFENRGLNLYEGITLASIVQRETRNPSDQKQVAQVFYSRIEIDMPLGADPTYQYIADKTGADRNVNLDSPYNTRRYQGLPPGPIASPGLGALLAVAEPADGDYLYFVGDDDDDNITHFARTFEEHEANIRNYCNIKCSTQ